MKKQMLVGSIPGRTYGYKNDCKAYLEWRMEEKNGKLCFSMAGTISGPNGYIVAGGQCIEKIASYFPGNPQVQQMLSIWKRWHLNDLNEGCEHQRELWDTSEMLEIVKYKLTSTAYQMRNNAFFRAAIAYVSGTDAKLTDLEKSLVLLQDWYYDRPAESIPENIRDCFEEKSREMKTAGWVYPTEHHKGLLSKPCPVCGYKYGTAWLHEDIPDDIVEIIKSW